MLPDAFPMELEYTLIVQPMQRGVCIKIIFTKKSKVLFLTNTITIN